MDKIPVYEAGGWFFSEYIKRGFGSNMIVHTDKGDIFTVVLPLKFEPKELTQIGYIEVDD